VYVIARRLGLDPKTVHRYADAPDPEALIGHNGTARDSILDRFKPYLQQRCAEGVTATNQLLARSAPAASAVVSAPCAAG
jgi:hypothetical protein